MLNLFFSDVTQAVDVALGTEPVLANISPDALPDTFGSASHQSKVCFVLITPLINNFYLFIIISFFVFSVENNQIRNLLFLAFQRKNFYYFNFK